MFHPNISIHVNCLPEERLATEIELRKERAFTDFPLFFFVSRTDNVAWLQKSQGRRQTDNKEDWTGKYAFIQRYNRGDSSVQSP